MRPPNFDELADRQKKIIDALVKRGVLNIEDFSSISLTTEIEAPKYAQGIGGESFEIAAKVRAEGYGVVPVFVRLVPDGTEPVVQRVRLAAGESRTFRFPVYFQTIFPDQMVVRFSLETGILVGGTEKDVTSKTVHVQVRRS